MKSKTLTALVLAGALAANGVNAYSQQQQMITEPDNTGIVQEYYYMPGVSGIYGYKDKDGSVIILQPQAKPDNGISGNYTIDDRTYISDGIYSLSTWFNNGDKHFISEEKDFLRGLEGLVSKTLALPEVQQNYEKKGKLDKNYYESREFLFREIGLFYKAQSIKPMDGDLLTLKSAEAYLNNDFYLNSDILENSSSAVFNAYEQMANMYYKMAVSFPEGSADRKKYAALCVEHAYEIPAKRFGEEKWLSLMGKDQAKYIDYVESCYVDSEKKISNTLLTMGKRIVFGK